MAVVAETRISHSVARVTAAPAVAPSSLSRQVRNRCPGAVLDFLRTTRVGARTESPDRGGGGEREKGGAQSP